VTKAVTLAVIQSRLAFPLILAFSFSGSLKSMENPRIHPISEPEYGKTGTGTPKIPALHLIRDPGYANPISRMFRHG
jgi:hypothetical protein